MKVYTSLVASILFLLLLIAPTEALAIPIQNLNGATGPNQTFQSDPNVTISTNPSTNIHSLGWLGFLPISRGGTGAGSFTAGSLLFSNGITFTENNSNLFWDNANNRLGIGTSSPASALDVSGNAKVTNLISTGDATINTLTVGLGGGSVSLNTAIGKDALFNNTTGLRNTAVGYDTLYHNSDSQNNVALGFRSLHENTTGSENVAIGYNSLFQNVAGGGNVVIGANAGWQQADGSYLTSVTDNIYIGGDVRGYNNDNNSIVIGNATTVGAGSNTAVVGNSSMTDVYFGSSSANANTHAKKMFLGASATPGCIIMGDTAGGVGYITLSSGVLTVSSTPPSACQ